MKKILIIRFRRVGDAVISSTLCSSLKKTFPDSEIHYVLNKSIAPLFEGHPGVDKIITFTPDELDSISKYIRRVRRIMKENKYDIIVDTRSTVKTLFFSLFSLGTKYRIGRRKWYNSLLQNHRVNNDFRGDNDNVQATLSLLDPLGQEFDVKKEPRLILKYTDKEYNDYRAYMASGGIDFSKPVILCTVTARLEHKAWPKEYMAEILTRIISKYDAQLIFNFGDDKEKEAAENIRGMVGRDENIFTGIEAKGLRELIALLANSTFFFGNEGGPRHMSQAVDIPSFAIYPPGIQLNNWLPNKSERFQGIELEDIDPEAAHDPKLSYGDKFGMIDVESVWNRLDPMLERYLLEGK